jgi:hypothetical protein
MQTMTAGRFRHVPVVEDGRLMSIISIGASSNATCASIVNAGFARIYRDRLGRRACRGDSPDGVRPRQFDMLADFGGRLADRLAAGSDQFVGAMKLEHSDVAHLDLHQGVRRIASQPGRMMRSGECQR